VPGFGLRFCSRRRDVPLGEIALKLEPFAKEFRRTIRMLDIFASVAVSPPRMWTGRAINYLPPNDE
jgi:hypothetical protein